MKINMPFLFKGRRQLVEIPPAFHAGDPAAEITTNISPEVVADEIALRDHRTEEGHRLAFAETLAKMNADHEARVRAIRRQDRIMAVAAIISFLVLVGAVYFAYKTR